MSMEELIKTRLAVLGPVALRVVNESHLHAGHAGDDGSGESHFSIEIKSPAFAGQSRVASHRLIHETLGIDVLSRIHALSIKATPS